MLLQRQEQSCQLYNIYCVPLYDWVNSFVVVMCGCQGSLKFDASVWLRLFRQDGSPQEDAEGL